MVITKNSAVFINYILTDSQGSIIEQSSADKPLAYLQGHNNIILGLERQLLGKAAGDKLTVVVEPEEAYGEYQEQAIQQIPREEFQGVETIEVGMQFHSPEKKEDVTVISVSDDMVTVDTNHPLAGKQLTFDVEIVNVRAGDKDEIDHGHVHDGKTSCCGHH